MTNVYPYLPEGGIIEYVPITNSFMAEAKRVCLEGSTDHNHPTGAVVVRDGVVLGTGANQSALRNPVLLSLHKKYLCLRKLLKIKSGEKYWICPGCASSEMHAESRAVNDALKKNSNLTNLQGADLYLWGHWWACKPCWDSMLGAEIKGVYLVDDATSLFKK